MKNGMRLVLILVITTTCGTLGLPQANTTPKRIFELNGKIETSYDQVKEITTVRLNPMQVYGEPLASPQYIGGDEY